MIMNPWSRLRLRQKVGIFFLTAAFELAPRRARAWISIRSIPGRPSGARAVARCLPDGVGVGPDEAAV